MKLSYRTQANAQAIAKIYNKPLENKEWFKIVNAKTENDTSEILLFDYIGWPYNDPRDLIEALSGMGDVLVRINSPGGDVWDGTAIYNAFSSHKGGIVTVRIEGIAASMASVIAMAGKPVQAYDNTMLMIHSAWSFTAGNQYELAEMADLLSKVDVNILSAYQEKTKKSKKDLSEMMKATTYLTAKKAKELGFVDEIVTGKSVKATYDLSIFGETPENISTVQAEGGRELTTREIEHALRNAGASKNFAKAFIAGRNESDDQRDVDDLKKVEDANQWDAEIAENLKTIIANILGGYQNG